MSNVKTVLDKGLSNIMNIGGLTTTVKIFNYTFTDSDYDDVTIKTLTGSQVVSGLIFPIKSIQGSEEDMLLQQGKLLTSDSILYTGSVNISGNQLVEIKGNNYTIIPEGVHSWEVNGSTIYNKFYLRLSNTGSLF